MTGLKMRVGDEGQRYEVRCTDGNGKMMVMGWAGTLKGTEGFVDSVKLHPVMHNPKILDRETGEEIDG